MNVEHRTSNKEFKILLPTIEEPDCCHPSARYAPCPLRYAVPIQNPQSNIRNRESRNPYLHFDNLHPIFGIIHRIPHILNRITQLIGHGPVPGGPRSLAIINQFLDFFR